MHRHPLLVPVRSLLNRLDRAFDRLGYWFLVPFSIYYFAMTVRFAANKRFWYDEIFTIHIASLPSVSGIWAALATGLEQFPPLTHLLIRWPQMAFGMGHVASRLPMIVAFWVMCVCLFVIVARRGSFAAAGAAAMFPLTTNVYLYAAEARPYALLLAFAGLACVFWLHGRDSKRWAHTGLALALAAAVSSHYYGCLLLVPFGAAQLAETLREKRLHPWRWIAMLAGILLPLVVYSPLMASAWKQAAIQPFGKPGWGAFTSTYANLLHWQFVLLVVVISMAAARVPAEGLRRDLGGLAMLVGFASMPAVACVIGVLITGVFYDRYAVGVVVGFALALGYALSTERLRGAGPPLLVFLVALFPFSASKNAQRSDDRLPPFTEAFQQLSGGDGEAIATADPITYLPLWFYAREELKARIIFVADAAREGLNSKDVRVFTRLFGGTILEIDDFQNSTERNFVLSLVDRVVADFEGLLSSGFTLRIVSRFGNYGLFRIEPGDPPAHRTPPG